MNNNNSTRAQIGTQRSVDPKVESRAQPSSEIPEDTKPPNSSRRIVSWPDPDPRPNQPVFVDDVTRLNAKPVARVFTPRNLDDILHILQLARHDQKRVSVRGTKHSMGGHTIAEDGYVISMKLIKHISYDRESGFVTAGSGQMWTDVIVFLNKLGLSPRTMQSYSSFSVGGTLSVNAHGITTDFTISECVHSFRLIKWNGTVVVCSREAEGEAKELFGLALGGYGMFGIIFDVVMKVNRNVHLDTDVLHLTPKEFPRLYEHILTVPSEDVEIKLARLDITNLEHIELFLFRRSTELPTVSALTYEPRSQSLASRMIYKWLAPTMQELRFKLERQFGFAMDWSDANERNLLMFESADSLAQLSNLIFQVDDTFILQEYFVPREAFLEWLSKAKPIYQEITNHNLLTLLNTTIRFVHKDTDTALPYSTHETGMYAFVLYYRMQRTEEADNALKQIHQKFVKITQDLGGNFYLPYRHHYSLEEMKRSYPTATQFFAQKEKYDPKGLFDSWWFREYGLPWCSEPYRMMYGKTLTTEKEKIFDEQIVPQLNFTPPIVDNKREGSYRKLVGSPQMRRDFVEGFLTNVFNLEDKKMLYRMISRAVWDPQNKTDLDVYSAVQHAVAENKGPIGQLAAVWKQVNQLKDQKQEIACETASAVSKLGKMGQLHDYVSIGDHGKMVLSLRKILHMKGKTWVVHDTYSEDVPAVLERGSADPVGIFQSIDYAQPGRMRLEIPDAGCDLVTLNQGLHHFPQNQIMPFLAEVYRVLRPGGIFICREHDAVPELMPMLDLAHSIFNAVLGVPRTDEETEIRAFRPISEWRKIVQAAGFVDSLVYEVQKGDPTIDEMMCFYKPPLMATLPTPSEETIIKVNTTPETGSPALAQLASQLPRGLLNLAEKIKEQLLKSLPDLGKFLKGAISGLSSGQRTVAESVIDNTINPWINMINRFDPYFKHIDFSPSGGFELVPSELFLIVPALKRKVKQGKASPMEMLAVAMIKDIRKAFFPKEKDKVKKDEIEIALEPVSADVPEVSTREVVKAIEEIYEAIPELNDPSWMTKAGFSSLAIVNLKGKLAAASTDDLAKNLSSVLDPISWKACQEPLRLIKESRTFPHVKLLFGKPGQSVKDNPWGHLSLAILSSPKVYFKSEVIFMAKWAGLGDMIKLWQLAQQKRRSEEPLQSTQFNTKSLEAALEDLSDSQLVTVEMAEGEEENIPNVGEIVLATFGYRSLTASPHNVTEKIKTFLQNGTLKLKGRKLKEELFSSSFTSPSGALDNLRKIATLNHNKLLVKYYSNKDPVPTTLLPKARVVLQRLAETGMVPNIIPSRDPTNTWWKLSEWMQVEMIQIFAQSMNHTPWYRFPFMKFLGMYWSVLGKEFNVVSEKYGRLKAATSGGLFVDLIPGIVMALIMGQMQLLALPVIMRGGEDYDRTKTVETITLKYSGTQPDFSKIDSRIQVVRAFVPGLVMLKIPTFQPFTEILLKLARNAQSVRVLEISGQLELQVKVEVPQDISQTDLQKINSLPGCKPLLTFEYPVSGTEDPSPTSLALSVSVVYLMSAIRTFDLMKVKVVQVYDTF